MFGNAAFEMGGDTLLSLKKKLKEDAKNSFKFVESVILRACWERICL